MADKNEKPKLVLARPLDRSLEAFKRWIDNMVSKIMGDASRRFDDRRGLDQKAQGILG